MTLASLFLIIIFMSIISAAAWLMLLLAQSFGRIKLPHGLYVGFMAFSVVPVKFPTVKLVDTDPTHGFVTGFETAAKVWLIGMAVLILAMSAKAVILKLSVRRFKRCEDRQILRLVEECSKQVYRKVVPSVLYGTLTEPACVISCFRPVIVLSKAAAGQLSEEELRLVLLHELTHIKRLHLPLQRAFDFLCCIHWFNPLLWIARRKFTLSCELDCDCRMIQTLSSVDETAYAKMLLHLVELSFSKPKALLNSAGVLAFMNMQQRLKAILAPASTFRRIAAAASGILILCCAVWLSLALSISTFPPYAHPSGNNQFEWSEQSNASH